MTKQKPLMKSPIHDQRRTATEEPTWNGQEKTKLHAEVRGDVKKF